MVPTSAAGIAAAALAKALAGEASTSAAAAGRGAMALRIGVDGAVPADRALISHAVGVAVSEAGGLVLGVSGEDFLLPRSVRLEHGDADADAGYERWYDTNALLREVLDPLGPGGSGRWLPSLWDAATDRATRAPARSAPLGSVLVLDAPFLLRWELSGAFDVVVHLTTSHSAAMRRLPGAEVARVTGSWARYLAETDPAGRSDVLVRCEDPAHPAMVTPN